MYNADTTPKDNVETKKYCFSKLSLLSLLSLKPSQQEWWEGVVMAPTCFLALF